ncbi:MAG: AraC family transcriptional regulator [Chloroflexi bacterium]|nr:AraC family transcriptional regulator [Chloroflexota bacterium]
MPDPIEAVTWRPRRDYDLALEVLSIADLRRRAPVEHFRRSQRPAFFLLLGVTRGRTRHLLDFTPLPARRGTWLLVRPGQVQRFDFRRPWDGLLVVFRPELLPPADEDSGALGDDIAARIARLPSRVELSPEEHELCCAAVRQIARDAAMGAAPDDCNVLMLHELCALLLRLELAGRRAAPVAVAGASARRVARLRDLVERELGERREVGWYARRLGLSERTLTRATRAVAGLSARALIADRIALEAKRLLVHTSLSIGAVAERLGFLEPSNFVKFFRRATGRTPSEFRRRHRRLSNTS